MQNRLLDAYAREQGNEFVRHFETVSLNVRDVLCETGNLPKYVHLISSGAVSTMVEMRDGKVIEASFIANEGFPEAFYLLGPQSISRRCTVQVKGAALRMRFDEFAHRFHGDATLHRLVHQWVQYEALVATQISACNGLHKVEERLARWLLMVDDRIREPQMPLTQELLGQMLGTRRATVTLALSQFQANGMIDSQRGHICLRSRAKLEKAACECYHVLHKLYVDLFQ